MSHRIFCLIALFASLVSPVAYSAYWSPLVGVDYKYWGLGPNAEYIGVYPHVNNTVNIYAGTRINGFFGIEFGYEESENRHTTAMFIGDSTEHYFAQLESTPGASSMIDMRVKSMHIDLNFYWQIRPQCEIIFMTGLAFLTPETHINYFTPNDGWLPYRGGAEQKSMGRIGLGFQYNIVPCFGIKALLSWEPDVRIVWVGFDQDNVAFISSPYKTSTMFNIGIVYSFSNPRRHEKREFIEIYDCDL